MLFLQMTVVRKPICPTFVHDDATRIVICVVGITVCLYALYRIMKYFGEG